MAVNQGAMVLFHVTSPCGLGFTKCGDWLKWDWTKTGEEAALDLLHKAFPQKLYSITPTTFIV